MVIVAPPLPLLITMIPLFERVNWLLFPTVNSWLGLVVPMPMLPFVAKNKEEVAVSVVPLAA